MIKWKKNGAGDYSTTDELFNVYRTEEEGFGVCWNLYSTNPEWTLDGMKHGAVDSFNTKWEAQQAAAWLVSQGAA